MMKILARKLTATACFGLTPAHIMRNSISLSQIVRIMVQFGDLTISMRHRDIPMMMQARMSVVRMMLSMVASNLR